MAHQDDTAMSVQRHVRKALVVDDSLSARRALAEFVTELGFEVQTASDGVEAVAKLEQNLPDILLVDMEMPRMNGLESTAHVRSHDATQHLPVIMITTRSTEKHRQNAARAGVNMYLIKPFSDDDLAARIEQRMLLLLPQSEVRTLESVLDIHTGQPPVHGIGWLSFESQDWSVYGVDTAFNPLSKVPVSQRICALLALTEGYFGLLCSDVATVQGSAVEFRWGLWHGRSGPALSRSTARSCFPVCPKKSG